MIKTETHVFSKAAKVACHQSKREKTVEI